MECPSCGHEIDPSAEVRFDDEAGVITGRGRGAYLTKTEMEVIMVLRDRYPRVVSKASLIELLYPIEADEPDMKIIDVFLCKIRQKIEGTGLGIDTLWGRGARLRYPPHEL